MKRLETGLAAVAIVALVGLAAGPLQAFDAPKNTVFDVTDPIRVGNTKLNAGTYVIRVVDRGTDLNVLQVTDRDLLTVHATFQARQHSVQASNGSSQGTLTFDGVPGQALLLRSWDLPNRSFGYDILTSAPKAPRVATLVVKGSPLNKAAR